MITNRARDGDTEVPTANIPVSEKARFNWTVLKKLHKHFEKDPDTNLLDRFPTDYSARLASRAGSVLDQKESNDAVTEHQVEVLNSTQSINDTYQLHSTPATILFPLSTTVQSLLGLDEPGIGTLNDGLSLSKMLSDVIEAGEKLWPPAERLGHTRQVIKCSTDLIVKIERNSGYHVEYDTLKYLTEHIPEFPIPRAHGILTVGPWKFSFMTYIPGVTLESVWPNFKDSEKSSMSQQLDKFFLDLRRLPFPKGFRIGAVSGTICTDCRREPRLTTHPIRSIDEFDDFRYSNPLFGSSVYIEFLRNISNNNIPTAIAFTHGDVRTANILVQYLHGAWVVSGIIDWERSGFYPEDFESTKITTTMSPNEEDDWFLFLPPSISPGRYPTRWLLDRLWARNLQ